MNLKPSVVVERYSRSSPSHLLLPGDYRSRCGLAWFNRSAGQSQHEIAQYGGDHGSDQDPQSVIDLKIRACLFKRQGTDEQTHGEAYPTEYGHTIELQPIHSLGQLGHTQFDRDPGKSEHTQLISKEQTGGYAKWYGMQQGLKRQTFERDTGVGEGE